MKCLICKTDEADYSLVNIKANYPCFCANCFWSEAVQYDTFVEVLEAHLKGLDTPQAMSTLKFPTDKDYPEGCNWFAYDKDGKAWFYIATPDLAEEEWYLNPHTKAFEFCVNHSVDNWDLTLRRKGQSGVKNDDGKLNYLQVLNPDFIPTVTECCKILEQGAEKYGQDNWKLLDKSRVQKALLRHLMAYLANEIVDSESQQKHLSHVITNCLFLNWFEENK